MSLGFEAHNKTIFGWVSSLTPVSQSEAARGLLISVSRPSGSFFSQDQTLQHDQESTQSKWGWYQEQEEGENFIYLFSATL